MERCSLKRAAYVIYELEKTVGQLIDEAEESEAMASSQDLQDPCLWEALMKFGFALRKNGAEHYINAVWRYANRSCLQQIFKIKPIALPFMALQLSRYLQWRGCFGSLCEQHMVCDLIKESYEELVWQQKPGILALRAYRQMLIDFPFCQGPSGLKFTVFYDFAERRLLARSSPCPCCSGLEFAECCGLYSF